MKERPKTIRLAIQELDEEALHAMIRIMLKEGNPNDETDKAFVQELAMEQSWRDARKGEA